jgi:hypothetical protein
MLAGNSRTSIKNGDPEAAVVHICGVGPSLCGGQPSNWEAIKGMETSESAAATA